MTAPSTDPGAWGIQDGYDARGRRHTSSAETTDALMQALGAHGEPPGPGARFMKPGEKIAVGRPAELVTEGGSLQRVEGELPDDLPLGYHRLTDLESGREQLIIAGPGRCYLPKGLRTWGWALQLYALRSQASWGLGDLADLRSAGRWSANLGAGVVLVNPLHAVAPSVPQPASPYFPSSRCWRNPLYIRVEDVPGIAAAGADVERLAASGRRLNQQRLIDRDAVFRLKMEALEGLFRNFPGAPSFDDYRTQQGKALTDFAVYNVLFEHHAGPPSTWGHEYNSPAASGIARFARAHQKRVEFHEWLQWLIDRQLAGASAETPLVTDLAIGVDPDGADAWMWQDAFAHGATVGAPPDQFNTRGQDWGSLAFAPHRLRAARYEPFIRTVRAALRHAGGMRFDHVMGLWRLFLIPDGAGPEQGAYVTYPAPELLDILALESHRAKAFVIGEDLGTVEVTVRREMAARSMLSYKVLWFEDAPPESYVEEALATVTNHDLPTVAGLWTGIDLQRQQEMGLEPDVAGTKAIARRLGARAKLGDGARLDDVIRGAYRLLAGAPSAVLTATLEDALGITERPNYPGTINEWPNWSLALPRSLEEIEALPATREIAELLRRGDD